MSLIMMMVVESNVEHVSPICAKLHSDLLTVEALCSGDVDIVILEEATPMRIERLLL